MKHSFFSFVPVMLALFSSSSVALPTADLLAPPSNNLTQYKTARSLWNYMFDRVAVVRIAELTYDHKTAAKMIPSAQASVNEFISRYPHNGQIWEARYYGCDLNLDAYDLGLPGALSLPDIAAEYEELGHDRTGTEYEHGMARARAIRVILEHIMPRTDVSPEKWKSMDAQITELQREFSPHLISYDKNDVVRSLRILYACKSKPFELKFTAVDGSLTDVANMHGKVVLIDFWATWCGPCMGEAPNVVAAYNKYHDKGFDVVGISLDQNKDALLAFTKEHGMVWSQYFDGKGWDNKISKKFEIHSIPAMWLIDKKGMLVTMKGCDDLDGQVTALLKTP